jgi:alpha-ribazole phosphatase
MLRLLLIRHGETDWNIAARFQGQSDIPLNRRGRDQAAALAGAVAEESIQALYASDLQRSWETAQAIAAAVHSAPRSEPRLREMSFGVWEGRTYRDIELSHPHALAGWLDDPSLIPPPHGETLTQVTTRIREIYNDIICNHPNQTVGLVAHGGPLRLLLCLALGLPPHAHWQLTIDLGSISELRIYEQGAILTRLNDTHHLYGASDDG